MSIKFKVLGKPGRDNGLFVWVNSGTRLYRIVFDCGENIFSGIKQHDIKAIDFLFLSHLHIDHIAGFDYYFRRNFDRQKPNLVWGPEDTSEILQNRLRGFKWNLTEQTEGEFVISDITKGSIYTKRFVTSESYKFKHETVNHDTFFENGNITVIDNIDFKINAAILDHRIPSAAYRITEKDSLNIDKEQLLSLGITPGNWLEDVRDLSKTDSTTIEVEGKEFSIGALRDKLLVSEKGDSIGYLTDFVYENSKEAAVNLIRGCDVVICESQYHHDDIELASKNYHMTSRQTAQLAKDAGVNKLILFHVSERYTMNASYQTLLEDAKSIFPETYFTDEWNTI